MNFLKIGGKLGILTPLTFGARAAPGHQQLLFANFARACLIGLKYLIRGSASSKSQGGQKAQFAPNFQEIHFLLHFYVTIFWIFQSQGGQLTPLTP